MKPPTGMAIAQLMVHEEEEEEPSRMFDDEDDGLEQMLQPLVRRRRPWEEPEGTNGSVAGYVLSSTTKTIKIYLTHVFGRDPIFPISPGEALELPMDRRLVIPRGPLVREINEIVKRLKEDAGVKRQRKKRKLED